jgi:hypothetical protein
MPTFWRGTRGKSRAQDAIGRRTGAARGRRNVPAWNGTAPREVDDMSRKPSGPAERSLADTSPLSDRPEWLGPRDIQEVFGIGRTKSYQVINALPHIRVGVLIRVNRRTVQKELLDKGKLP